MKSPEQVEFERTNGGRTQTERLRDYLMTHPCQWVPMPELARAISQTGVGTAAHSRITDCRRQFGMNIDVKMTTDRATGLRLSSYYYDPELPGNYGRRRKRAGAEV